MLRNSTDRYGSISIGLHWLTLAILIGVYACVNLTDLYPKASEPREALKAWHYMLGLTVLALVALRLLNRLLGPAPAITPPAPLWQQRLASATHVALYALMVVMPILGWLVLSAAGKPIPFFGIQLPALLAENKDLADQLKEVHETIGTIGYFLIGAHAMAALFHHFITQDNTLDARSPPSPRSPFSSKMGRVRGTRRARACFNRDTGLSNLRTFAICPRLRPRICHFPVSAPIAPRGCTWRS